MYAYEDRMRAVAPSTTLPHVLPPRASSISFWASQSRNDELYARSSSMMYVSKRKNRP